MIPGRHTAFSNNQSLVSILHRELERKMEKLEHMKLTWDQAQFERFSYILYNGYRWNWAWYKLLQVCARYGQILAVTLIGC